MKIKLNFDEVLSLKKYLEKLTFWDYRSLIRIQIKNINLGIFGSTPFNALAFIALPMEEDLAEVDLVVSAADILKQLKDDKATEIFINEVNKPAPELALLPPNGPWMPGEKGIAGDIFPLVKDRLEKLNI